ncbi:MAG: glycolate oxidase subunit GlcF, partial [Burkholderiales bacterium]
MKTNLAEFIKNTPEGKEADGILRTCVHCGFCTATCPTYQLLGDELDSPRGRIYLIKEVLEGNAVTAKTQLHLDRCLTCRACETTCPSGVQYGRLVDIGRNIVEKHVPRTLADSIRRTLLRLVIPTPWLFNPLLKVGQELQALLPLALRRKVPAPDTGNRQWPQARHARKMLVLDGCVQPALAPSINAAAARVLDRVGISLIKAREATCCGAVTFHLNKQEQALQFMRRNIDAWWPHIEAGAEAIVITASGCGTLVREYGHHLAHDPMYAKKAHRVSTLTRDLSEVVFDEKQRLETAFAFAFPLT